MPGAGGPGREAALPATGHPHEAGQAALCRRHRAVRRRSPEIDAGQGALQGRTRPGAGRAHGSPGSCRREPDLSAIPGNDPEEDLAVHLPQAGLHTVLRQDTVPEGRSGRGGGDPSGADCTGGRVCGAL